ncbi:MAG TPA: alpha/beta fold hydrolase [Gemmataceae bacterium]|nr:alpha/beta fold hydrolase [Gemmataceae bacterium]
MLVDLVQTTTRDGLQLDGIFQSPGAASGGVLLEVEVFCLLHGTGGNFYSSALFGELAEQLLGIGCAVLRVNTRGHDGISTAATARGGKRLGAAYETIDDARHDLAAWMEWLKQQGSQRIGVMGHSMGAVKAIYSLAREPQLSPVCLVALSPPRLSYLAFCAGSGATQFLDSYSRAEQLVASGQPTALMEVQTPLPYVTTAAGYVEKYGPDERYNLLRSLPGVNCPTLVTIGSREAASNMAFQRLPEDLEALCRRQQSLHVEVIPDADHAYTGVRSQLFSRIVAWLSPAAGKST